MATIIINEKTKVGKNLLKMLKALACIENEGSIRFLDETDYIISNTAFAKELHNRIEKYETGK
jgi:hypothetical protein